MTTLRSSADLPPSLTLRRTTVAFAKVVRSARDAERYGGGPLRYGISLMTGVLTTTGLPRESTPLNVDWAVWFVLLPLHHRAPSDVVPLAGMSIAIPWMLLMVK